MLFFLHIPKAAGVSIRHCLQASIGDRFVLVRPNGRPEFRPSTIRSRLPTAGEAVLFGHFSYGFHRRFLVRPRYAAVLRHPVDRVVSWYRWTEGRERAPSHAQVKQGVSLLEMIETGANPSLTNEMVRYVAGRRAKALDDERTLRLAKRHLGKFAFVSVLEELPANLHRLSELVGSSLAPLPHRNQSTFTVDLDEETRRAILKANALDLELYELARKLSSNDFTEAEDPGVLRRYLDRFWGPKRDAPQDVNGRKQPFGSPEAPHL
jgi:hypothetical protein